MGKNTIRVMTGLFLTMVFGLAGCGGGGGTTVSATPTVSGTASEGALITGKTVKLKDANGKSAVDGTTNVTTGIYSIDVTGLTAPFLVTVTGSNGTYVSLAQTAGTANINPITTTVVALAVGNSDVSALFTNLKTSELTTINTNYAAKAALVTASLQSALPSGIKADDYFTGTISAGKDMDAVFDAYQIAIDPASGITVKTKDANATTVLTIPATTVTANTTQALPTIVPTNNTTFSILSGDGTFVVNTKTYYRLYLNSDGKTLTELQYTLSGSSWSTGIPNPDPAGANGMTIPAGAWNTDGSATANGMTFKLTISDISGQTIPGYSSTFPSGSKKYTQYSNGVANTRSDYYNRIAFNALLTAKGLPQAF